MTLRRYLSLWLMLCCCVGSPSHAGEYSFYDDPASWTDELGEPSVLGRWRGKPMIISMGYPTCRKVCATTTLVFKEIQKVLDARGKEAEFVLISFDEKATPADWLEFRKRRKLERRNWHFLIGSAKDAQRLSRQIGVEYWYDLSHATYLHDFRILVLDADGHRKSEIDWDHIGEEDIARLF
jgi:cytochrome oxidase Cu insertion factor (SCO1/SenC/PrrC family)